MQLYTGGSVGSSLFDQENTIDLQTYSIDPDSPSPEEDEESTVTVPEVEIGLMEGNLQTSASHF